jgi:3-hydroxymyristoyl/3-hydroxydecanoyl-(acyl carrier protein) dehydratase
VTGADPVVIERLFQPDHPAAQGHFPGNPIIPGAVLLSETIMAIEHGLSASLAPFQIISAKFLQPARPGDRVLIEFSRSAGGEIRFACTVGGRPVLTGQITCRALPTAP